MDRELDKKRLHSCSRVADISSAVSNSDAAYASRRAPVRLECGFRFTVIVQERAIMNFFKKRKPAKTEQPSSSIFSAGLPKAGEDVPASLKAHSQFIKRVNCSQC